MMRRLVLFSALSAIIGLCVSADESKKPQWQRLLTGDDANKAAELEKRTNELVAKENYEGAIRVAEEVHAFRTKLQGADHYEVSIAKFAAISCRKLGELSADKWQGWRRASEDPMQANLLGAKGRFSESLPKRETWLIWCRQVLGEEHPDTVAAYYTLAGTQVSLGKYAAAHAKSSFCEFTGVKS